MDIAIVPKGWLKPGENNIHIGYSDERYDDFIVDNLVLWYKTTQSGPDSKKQSLEIPYKVTGKDIDSLEDLSALDVKILKDVDEKGKDIS